jgi:hypothetical protein
MPPAADCHASAIFAAAFRVYRSMPLFHADCFSLIDFFSCAFFRLAFAIFIFAIITLILMPPPLLPPLYFTLRRRRRHADFR